MLLLTLVISLRFYWNIHYVIALRASIATSTFHAPSLALATSPLFLKTPCSCEPVDRTNPLVL